MWSDINIVYALLLVGIACVDEITAIEISSTLITNVEPAISTPKFEVGHSEKILEFKMRNGSDFELTL